MEHIQDPVVLALKSALANNDDENLRLALGRRMLELHSYPEALAEFEACLRLNSASDAALEGAKRAATAVGDAAKAEAYGLALAAMQKPTTQVGTREGGSSAAQAAQTTRLRIVDDDDPLLASETSVTFQDVGGLEDVKERLRRSFVLPLRRPDVFAKFGKSIRGGLLLYGPPGCGKTFVARALAGEIGARFLNVGLSDVLDMWLGESERKLHELFENARRLAPVVLFFDEIDALGQRRTQLKHSAGRNIVNQLLSEMDGIQNRNDGLFVLGATNHPWDVDTALRRPGRFDRMVFVPSPDTGARERILALKLEGRPVRKSLKLAQIVKRTDGYSGADLQAIVDAATELAFEETVSSEKERLIDEALLETALGDVKSSMRPWLETARNYAIYANEGGVYDDLLAHLRSRGMA